MFYVYLFDLFTAIVDFIVGRLIFSSAQAKAY